MSEEETAPNLEQERIVETAWIFDVDGVITNPQEKRITEPEILDQIAKRLEKGGTWAEFDEEGNLIESKDDTISIPDSLKEEVRNITNSDYPDTMFFDEAKQTMISVEMKDGHPLEDFSKKQQIFASQLRALLVDKGLDNKLKVDPTTIAIDIENKHVGKHFAVKRIIEWVKNKGISPKKYIAFGDSFRSDVLMAEEIHSQGFPVEFVYVGQENVQTADYPFPITQPIAPFGNGTLEYLKSL